MILDYFACMQVMNLVQIGHISNMLLMSVSNEEILKEQSVRYAIAVELAGNPSILFLDEPMKGLDSHASRHIMECLKVCLPIIVSPCVLKFIAFYAHEAVPTMSFFL